MLSKPWHPAPSVAAALAQATALWPNRSTRSDGIIGDAAHAARDSDHNPDYRGIVHAFDLTHDPANGVDCAVLAERLRTAGPGTASIDPRIRYAIWNGRIFAGPLGGRADIGEWRPYDGRDPHTNHLHVSIGYTAAAETDTRPWWAWVPAPRGHAALPVLRLGSHGPAVMQLQRSLQRLGHPGLRTDGVFGAATLAAVRDVQARRHVAVDGTVGVETWRVLA